MEPRPETLLGSLSAALDLPGTAIVGNATLSASLVDREALARRKQATVQVAATGIQLVDPATVGELPYPGQGHLEYCLDGGTIIATTVARLSFHALTSGHHTIVVSLAQNDCKPLGAQQILEVTVP